MTLRAFLSHTTYQIVKERVQNFHFDPANIPNPLHPVKLILSLEVIAILSLYATTRRSRLFKASLMLTHRRNRSLSKTKNKDQVVKERVKIFQTYGADYNPGSRPCQHTFINNLEREFAMYRARMRLAYRTYTVKPLYVTVVTILFIHTHKKVPKAQKIYTKYMKYKKKLECTNVVESRQRQCSPLNTC